MSKTISHSQGGPEVKYLLQEGVSGKASLLASSRPLGISLKWRSVFSLCDYSNYMSQPLQEKKLGMLPLCD